MELSSMQFKTFVWPHNPETYTIEFERDVAVHKLPFGRYSMQNLGMNYRVMKGEGAFVGEDAYTNFKALASVFYEDTAGTLIHPVWQRAEAYFVSLYLTQEPTKDYVKYGFTFWETGDNGAEDAETVVKVSTVSSSSSDSTVDTSVSSSESEAVYYTVVQGDSLWLIGQSYGLEVDEILTLNSWIKNPNLIYPGEQVRVA